MMNSVICRRRSFKKWTRPEGSFRKILRDDSEKMVSSKKGLRQSGDLREGY